MANKIFTAAAVSLSLSFAPALLAEPANYWLNANFLYWKIQNSPEIIPLVVHGPVPPNGAPVLGEPDTNVILGGKVLKNKWQPGIDISVGRWLCDQHTSGVEIKYLFIPSKSLTKAVSSNGFEGTPIFAIPFIDANTGQESSEVISLPSNFSGTANLQINTSIQGAELNGIRIYPYSKNVNVGFSGGLRFFNFNDQLTFDTSSPNILPAIPDTYLTHEKFKVINNFIGPQFGVNTEYTYKQFSVNAVGKVGLGIMFQKSEIDGYLLTNTFNNHGTPVSYAGGYFAVPSNMGTRTRNTFAIIPEFKLNATYLLTHDLKLQLGYTFLYVSNVLRASKQMNRTINPTQAPALDFNPNPVLVGPAVPTGALRSQSVWAQGFNLGFEYTPF